MSTPASRNTDEEPVLPAPHSHHRNLMWPWVVILVVAIFAFMALGYYNSQQHATTNANRISSLSSAVQLNASAAQAIRNALSSANVRITEHGGSPVPTPVVTIVSGASGPPGPAGQNASEAQIVEAVDSYFSQHPVRSPTVDYAAIYNYVNAYLADHPGKPGKPGAPGASGASGASGQPGVEGPSGAAGQNATDAQVAAAVADYLARNPPPAGPSGPPGKDGEPPLSWTFSYTDLLGVSHTETCTRDTPFDRDNPTYTCNADTSTGTPSP